MGIEGLWKMVKPAGVTHYLPDYTHSRTLKKQDIDGPPSRLPVLGIDASIWMHETQAVFHNRHHASNGRNPELRTLLYRLCSLLEMCNTPVFIFDGIGRPDRKRGFKVIKTDHGIAVDFREIIETCGFNHHQAPGEAEAELAALNKLDRVDIVHSSDSDTLVFGAKCVAKSARDSSTSALKKSTKHRIEVYEAAHLRTHPDVEMSPGGFLLVALVMGGDYDPVGIAGCGEAIAKGLAATDLGNSLRRAFLTMSPAAFNKFRTQWRLDLCDELKTNSSGCLPRKNPALARRIPLEFPDVRIINLYNNPEVSPLHILEACQWTSRAVDIPKLARICEKHFSWGDAAGIAAKFRSRVFGGIAFRQLVRYDELGTSEAVQDAALISPSLYCVAQRARLTNTLPTRHYIMRLYIDHLQQKIPWSLNGDLAKNPIPADDLSNHFINFHAPAFLVEPIRHLFTLDKYGHQTQAPATKGGKTTVKQEKAVTKGKIATQDVIEFSDSDDANMTPPTSSLSSVIELSDSDEDLEMAPPDAAELTSHNVNGSHASTSTSPPVIELSDSDDDDKTPPPTISTLPSSSRVENKRPCRALLNVDEGDVIDLTAD